MDTIASLGLLRPAEDIAAEGMWRIATGESCEECWEALSEPQKAWWRRCAMEAVRGWIASHCQQR